MIKMSQTIDIILQPIYAIKIVRIKQKRRNKMCKDNHNDIYDDNNNSNNKSQFDLRKILVL